MSLTDMRQNMRMAKSERDTKGVARGVEETQEQIVELRDSLQKLSFFCTVMWELLEEATDLSEQDLKQKVQQMEAKARAASTCAECGRPKVSRKATDCLYCGASFPKEVSITDLLQA